MPLFPSSLQLVKDAVLEPSQKTPDIHTCRNLCCPINSPEIPRNPPLFEPILHTASRPYFDLPFPLDHLRPPRRRVSCGYHKGPVNDIIIDLGYLNHIK